MKTNSRDPVRRLTCASSDIHLGSFDSHVLALRPEHGALQKDALVPAILATRLTQPQPQLENGSGAILPSGTVRGL